MLLWLLDARLLISLEQMAEIIEAEFIIERGTRAKILGIISRK